MINWLTDPEAIRKSLGFRGFVSISGDKVISDCKVANVHYTEIKVPLEVVLHSKLTLSEGLIVEGNKYVTNECDFLEVTNADPISKMQSFFIRAEVSNVVPDEY